MRPDGNINRTWELRGYSDMDYTGDKDTQKRVTGYIFLINREVIACSVLIKKTVTLSITDAEYSVITDLCCKILFVCVILLFMVVVVEYPITMHVDNVGDIFLSENTSVSQQTKHIDVRHDFICDYVEERTVKFKIFRSE